MPFMRKRPSAIAIAAVLFCAAGCSGKDKGAATGPSPKILTDGIRAAYIVSEAAKGVWRIDENGKVNMFLVLGESKAMLIDTGCGEAGLDAVVASLTSLPVIVVNTHGHNDHAMGNGAFQTIYAHPDDLQSVRYMSGGGHEIGEAINGEVFDLGGRKLSVIETAGHTKGSICLLDAENRILFTGDNDNTHVWLFLGDALSVEEYLGNLEKLIARSKEFDLILPGHGESLDPSHLSRLAESCRAIMKGVQGRPYQSYSGALSYGPNEALIAYSPDKIFADR